jgi:glycosyltransferase involved in cell wall biosynthesis
MKEIKQVTLVVGKWQRAYFANLLEGQHTNLKIISVDMTNGAVVRNLWYLRHLPRLANDLNIDIVHLSFPIPVRRSLMQCPVIVSLHDLYPYDEPNNFGFPKVFFNQAFLQQCLKEVDCVCCVSEATLSRLKFFLSRLTDGKVTVIPNCVMLQDKEPIPPEWPRCPFVLMVAQHRANKNILFALRAFAELLRSSAVAKNTLLLLVGNQGPETKVIKAAIKQIELESNVKLLDSVTDGELRWFYENCELLLAPSLTEGFGLPVVEAALCGSRVVCSNIPAFREVGGKSSHYFDLHAESGSSSMVQAICDALAETVQPPEHLERFSQHNVAREYEALYTRLREDYLGKAGR